MVRTVDNLRVVRKRLRRLHRLYDAALGYVLSLNADYVLRHIVEQVGQILELDCCYVMLVNPETDELRLQVAWSPTGDYLPAMLSGPRSQAIRDMDWLGLLEAQVVTNRSAMIVPDTSDFPLFGRTTRLSHRRASMVSIPLTFRENVLGTLTVFSLKPRDFHAHEVVALTQLATPASLAIENERLYTSVRERLREKEVLLEGTSALAGKREINDILATLVTQMARVMEDAWCGLLLRDGEDLRLQADATWDVTASLEAATRHELGLPKSSARGRAAGVGQRFEHEVISIANSLSAIRTLNALAPSLMDLTADEDALVALARRHGVAAAMLVPLVHLGRARGIAIIGVRRRSVEVDGTHVPPGVLNRWSGSPFHEADARVLQALANQAAVAIENAQLLADEKRRSEEKVLLLEAARLAASSLDVTQGLEGFAEMCASCLQADQCIILRSEDEGRELRLCSAWGLPQNQREQLADIFGFNLDIEYLCRGVFDNRMPRIEKQLDAVELGPSERLLVTVCGARTLGVWPMLSQGPCNGLILLLFRAARDFTRSQIDMMYGVVRQASIFMANARLFEEVKERAERLKAISDLTETINSTRDLTSIFSIVARNTKKIVACDWSAVAVIERQENRIRIPVMSLDGEDANPIAQFFPLAESLVHDAVIGRTTVIRDDIGDIDSKLESVLTDMGIHSLVVIPLCVDHEVVATLNLGNRRRGAFDRRHVESLQEMADHLAMAFKNASMFEEISRINQELRQMDAIKSDFLSTVAHELRTPLTIIKGYMFVLLKDPKRFDSSVSDMLDIVDGQADHLKELIENLLSLSRLEANKGLLKLHVQNVRLDQLAEEICSNFRLAAKKKNLSLRADVTPDLTVEADRSMLVRVFYNLVGNAMKFTFKGGITISMRRRDDGMIECCVADTGIGVSQENVERIFERFFHVDGPDPRAPSGTGLGLAIVQQIVRAHGGEVHVESEVGSGTRFIFTLSPNPPAQDG